LKFSEIDGQNIDSSKINKDDCDLKAPLVGRNATERTPGSDGARIDRNDTGNGT
jgi:hypothetical protein